MNYFPRKTPQNPIILQIPAYYLQANAYPTISPHFEAVRSPSHPILNIQFSTPHPTRLFTSRFTPHLNPSPLSQGGERITDSCQFKSKFPIYFRVWNHEDTLSGFLLRPFGVLVGRSCQTRECIGARDVVGTATIIPFFYT
jgi:hypothetical protein